MNVLNKYKDNQGVTLLEILITIVVIGILATLSLPNMVGMFSKNNLSQAVQTIQSSLQDSQRQALRRGLKCNIVLDARTTPPQIFSPSDVQENKTVVDEPKNYDCLIGGNKQLPSDIAIASNLRINNSTAPKKVSIVQFSYKGQPLNLVGDTSNLVNPGPASQPAIIIIGAKGVKTAKCVVISPVIGMVRTGDYLGDTGGDPYQWVQNYAPNKTTALTGNPENSCQTQM
jgi:prepilin-type N-terminal cleavage/methylation domain-containing protein